MSYNGSGTFNINTTGQPVVAGTVITATAFNLLTADLATGLTTAITKDGQTTTTARIPFAQGISSTLVTDSTNTTTGSIITDGGVGIAKNLNVGGTLNVTGATTLTNPVINNIKMGYSTTATAGGSTSLTVSSNYRQFFTGTLAQTIVLPVTSTLVTGMAYEIENNSTGTLTVNSSGGNLVGTIPAGVCAHAVCIGTTLTTAADWDWDYISNTTITGTGSAVLANTPTIASLNLTTALTIASAAGTAGQVLTSGGSGAAPTWATAGASAATPTALGTVYGKTDTSSLAIFGYQAGNSNTGSENTFIGYQAGYTNSSGNYSTIVGSVAGNKNTTGNISAFGQAVLFNNTTGSYNSAFGGFDGTTQTMKNNTTGSNNCAFGHGALGANTASSNTAIGFQALTANTTGTPNTALGRALRSVTTGGQNVGVGDLAGEVLTTGTFNTFIGNNIDASSSSVSNAIVINAAGTKTDKGSNTGYINPGTGGVYQGNNSAAWSVTSDQRLKKNIVDNTEGLDKISQIRVRNFEYRLPEEVTELDAHCAIEKTGIQLGVIAQELQQVCSDCVKVETTGVMSVDSDNIFWHMVNAIKDLKALNDSLTARIVALENA